ncbi:uncharacterized protein LOC143348847 [Colletes latitarsis]|uniref:uncharacterized protein LOC143348847 n=1 Tax=Colletes latitarsis TaxID=2605962 RepID=UPI004036507E
MPSELDATAEINSTYPNGIPGSGTVVVRAEEALIVILVLFLWAAAIALFFNRWGKIRMLEPYQPKFQQQHRPSCTTIEPNQLQTRRTYSKCNVLCADELACVAGQSRPRQNSVFIGSSASLLPGSQGTPRRTKSAFDLQSLFLPECIAQEGTDQDASRGFKAANESTKLLQCDRRTSVCQSDRNDASKSSFGRDRGMSICYLDAGQKPWHRDRGMSICQFDRMDVLARPLQRDRGGSICHFDRMDVLARPLQRDRTGSAYHFDRTDVLARPSLSTVKSLLRERRVSICNFSEKDEAARIGQTDRRSSIGNIDKIEKDRSATEQAERQGIFAKCTLKDRKTSYHLDQPSCSKTSDVVFGYKATCV